MKPGSFAEELGLAKPTLMRTGPAFRSLPFRTDVVAIGDAGILDISGQAFDLQHLPDRMMTGSSLTHGIRKC